MAFRCKDIMVIAAIYSDTVDNDYVSRKHSSNTLLEYVARIRSSNTLLGYVPRIRSSNCSNTLLEYIPRKSIIETRRDNLQLQS